MRSPLFKPNPVPKSPEVARSSSDLLADFLRLKISANTRRNYGKAIADFCHRTYECEVSTDILTQFLSLHQPEAVYQVLQYRQQLIEAKLAPSTINVRLSALKSFVDYALTVEPCSFNLANVTSLKLDGSTIYRLVRKFSDAAGIDKIVSPHRIRHSAITVYLDASDGNIRAAQSLSRHANLNTLNRYDDTALSPVIRYTPTAESFAVS